MQSAIELTGTINEARQIQLDEPLPLVPKRVRVIVLYAVEDNQEASEIEWLRAASTNPAFDFLNDESEDIYTIEDGKPLSR